MVPHNNRKEKKCDHRERRGREGGVGCCRTDMSSWARVTLTCPGRDGGAGPTASCGSRNQRPCSLKKPWLWPVGLSRALPFRLPCYCPAPPPSCAHISSLPLSPSVQRLLILLTPYPLISFSPSFFTFLSSIDPPDLSLPFNQIALYKQISPPALTHDIHSQSSHPLEQ